MDSRNLIKKFPSIALLCQLPEEIGGAKDMVRFSSFYGDQLVDTNLKVSDGIITYFQCPFCEKDLTSKQSCELCGAPMVNMQLKKGGMLEYCIEAYERHIPKKPEKESFIGNVHFCSRRACQNRRINFENRDADLKEFYDSYSLFLQE